MLGRRWRSAPEVKEKIGATVDLQAVPAPQLINQRTRPSEQLLHLKKLELSCLQEHLRVWQFFSVFQYARFRFEVAGNEYVFTVSPPSPLGRT